MILGLDSVEALEGQTPGDGGALDGAPGPVIDGAAADAASLDGAAPEDSGTDGGNLQPLAKAGPSIAIGNQHICAIVAGRRVKCWGRGHAAGHPESDVLTQPTLVMQRAEGQELPLDGVIALGANAETTCALRDGAPSLVCWGRPLLAGSHSSSAAIHRVEVPGDGSNVPVTGAALLTLAPPGANPFLCMVSGSAGYCAGANHAGQLGRGAPSPFANALDSAVHRLHAPPLGLSQIVAGSSFACARTLGGGGEALPQVSCWGKVPLPGEPAWADVFLGGAPLEDVVRVAAGPEHACAVADKRAYCWGAPDARLGTSNAVDSDVDGNLREPRVVRALESELTGVVDVAAGARHTCFVTIPSVDAVGGLVHCAGSRSHGQTGEPADPVQTSPTADANVSVASLDGQVTNLELLRDVTEIAAGSNTSCARTVAGKVYCWGERHIVSSSGVAPHFALDMGI